MDIIQKNKVLVWTIAVLILLNLMSIGTFWFGFLRHSPPENAMRFHGPEEMMMREIGLSEEQAQAFKKEQQNHFESVRSIMDSVRSIKRDVFALLIAHPEDSVKVAILLQRSADYLMEADRLRYQHFIALRKLCKPEQLKAFDRFLMDMVDNMPPPKPGVFNGKKFQ